ncbi:hypothetical protein M6D93_04365 [Jatrophihabitans telluris]|uniref:Uncharacterized protein n=1 Tax=Jatrophihabitans telluris TaxID=2038343 RepID=A0ABY4R188_9ACTN|nr:hypothetical protein [Jatrophihabitans telluris]UQX89242.1 hypothetical protein M6D93_04365 [Jatrophihabitans telluris]
MNPMMTVLVLAVLWLIVVIPMMVQKIDARRGERSAARFSTAMRALSRGKLIAINRTTEKTLTRSVSRDSDTQVASAAPSRTSPHVFVPGAPAGVTAGRRPVPAAMEAMMYPERLSKSEMSEARQQMMARRRRSLTVLIAGTILGLAWSIFSGSTMSWVAGLGFLLSLGGYLSFLRSQALRDRDRRENRRRNLGYGDGASYDATEQLSVYEEVTTVVRIDDDDVALHGMADTIDLTGLYVEEEFEAQPMRRAV